MLTLTQAPSLTLAPTLTRYRFDTIFRANRMGNIMHHIMSGPASAKVSNIVQQSA